MLQVLAIRPSWDTLAKVRNWGCALPLTPEQLAHRKIDAELAVCVGAPQARHLHVIPVA
jgi:hypothetical protein